MPEKVRVSLGSATLVGLRGGPLKDPPETVYLMTFRQGRCEANCWFCAQARESKADLNHLSRVAWPVFETRAVLLKVRGASSKLKRICIQTLNYPEAFNDVVGLVEAFRKAVGLPISVSCQPFDGEQMRELKRAGVERMAVPLDASTKEIFERIKGRGGGGPYEWERHVEGIKEAVKIFGKGKVTTHVILGLGETDREFCSLAQWLANMGVEVALFALTPLKGTRLEKASPPPVDRYRKMQLARRLILSGKAKFERMKFSAEGEIIDFGTPKEALLKEVRSGSAFLTSGCPGCNRPYYNERVSGPIYNFPRPLSEGEKEEIKESLEGLFRGKKFWSRSGGSSS